MPRVPCAIIAIFGIACSTTEPDCPTQQEELPLIASNVLEVTDDCTTATFELLSEQSVCGALGDPIEGGHLRLSGPLDRTWQLTFTTPDRTSTCFAAIQATRDCGPTCTMDTCISSGTETITTLDIDSLGSEVIDLVIQPGEVTIEACAIPQTGI